MNNLLEIKDLHKSFSGVNAVDGVTFEVERGKITALIGPNGSGKTTVFNLISGILEADSGEINFETNAITDLPIHERARLGMSRMFQQSRLFLNLTIKDNLLLALDGRNFNLFTRSKATAEQARRIQDILELFELTKKINVQVKALSFGQRRLIEIARAYLLPHKLILLDEPVAGVTPHLRDDITKFLIMLRERGETMLIIEHDMNFVFNLADKVIVMDAGVCIATGKPEDIRNDAKVKEAYLGE
ncbi:MAG: ABC transporter ATP-binding protein [Candidatus Berkelbacteria bacterium]|nr:ABC transporter ATP-binding protein [Candidatus Berkelbacteria bacterium]